ncbi:TlpA family protein disulfide reductase [Nonomuraea sp. M3C6]|uniref:TlpA family protein disulfide reductase n=1 Tax=Nonomuraea marmarensis TaxID=3351344 RepID=A0ABW7AVK8_9ACTN
MTYLIGAVIIVGLLCLLDLLLTVGIMRRLRAHSRQLSKRSEVGRPDHSMISVGSEVGAFNAQAIDDILVSDTTMGDDALIAFLTPTCAPCVESVPKFVELAKEWYAGHRNVLSVVVGAREDATEMVSALGSVGSVTVEDHTGPLTSAFSVKLFPSFCRVKRDGDRLVVAEHIDIDNTSATAAS